MSDIIQLLPDSVANQIAAGEVIQRPASVIKELVENAVDAGAKNINVLVVDAGRTSIQVIDDGKGMSETDARLSFERHATSKIRSAEDLFSLHTMGFRGEALASVAAVAQIELKTRQASDEIGTLLSISGSKFTGQEPCSCPVGSNFSIENLFYNVPARRKFLKSNSTELNNIITAFERIALVYPDISFTLHSNGTEMFNLKAGVLRQRIIDIFGKRLNQDLLSVKVDTSMCKIAGYVGKPESARKKGAHQYFFVNGRYMKHPYFSKAVMNAFDRLVPMGEQVPYFIYFDINAEDIDVNIHPTKTEIKFENEQAIWQILSASVRESVGMFNDVPSIDFDTQGRPDIPVYNPENNVAAPKVQFNPTYNPFNTGTSAQPQTKSVDKWESLYNGLKSQASQDTDLFTSKMTQPSQDQDNAPTENIIAEKSPAHYQYKGCYIMTAVKSGLMIVDQHRAHVRILYDKYLEQMKNKDVPSQKILFPESIHLSATEDVTFNKIEPEMVKLGFEITALGGGSYAINAIPSGIEGLKVVELVHDIIVSAQERAGDITEETNRSLALTLARNASIPFGQVLSNDEMENIFNSLFASSNPNYTPDGKNILCILKQSEIEHLLG
ncbi:MAG: DNA mismatch repair endonuclease MutL [Prevotella sp.]|nr:DNA mismatch repair endonuclease MutL [Prevotella sp.]MBP8686777.1 DNA mismatch repair endonuclease MutL [Prevotella sp.]MBP8934128.1 DNA mismatch repair endonuclease MutL [Prevotella sp.]